MAEPCLDHPDQRSKKIGPEPLFMSPAHADKMRFDQSLDRIVRGQTYQRQRRQAGPGLAWAHALASCDRWADPHQLKVAKRLPKQTHCRLDEEAKPRCRPGPRARGCALSTRPRRQGARGCPDVGQRTAARPGEAGWPTSWASPQYPGGCARLPRYRQWRRPARAVHRGSFQPRDAGGGLHRSMRWSVGCGRIVARRLVLRVASPAC